MHKPEVPGDISRAPTILHFETKLSTAHMPQSMEARVMFLQVARPERQLRQNARAYVHGGQIWTSSNALDLTGSSHARAKRPDISSSVAILQSLQSTAWLERKLAWEGKDLGPSEARRPQHFFLEDNSDKSSHLAMYTNWKVASKVQGPNLGEGRRSRHAYNARSQDEPTMEGPSPEPHSGLKARAWFH